MNRVHLIFLCTFFMVVGSFSAPAAQTKSEPGDLGYRPSHSAETLLILMEDGRTYVALKYLEFLLEGEIRSKTMIRERVALFSGLVRSLSWSRLPAAERLAFLRLALAKIPLTARLQRELLYLAAEVGELDAPAFLLEYGGRPWTKQFLAGDGLPSILPRWRTWWAERRWGPVFILAGKGFVSSHDIEDLVAYWAMRHARSRDQVLEHLNSAPSSSAWRAGQFVMHIQACERTLAAPAPGRPSRSH